MNVVMNELPQPKQVEFLEAEEKMSVTVVLVEEEKAGVCVKKQRFAELLITEFV